MPKVQDSGKIVMARLEWTDDLAVGNAMIDEDHQQLVFLVNRFDDAIVSGADSTVRGNLLDELVSCTVAHFIREERLMQRIKYPEFTFHKSQHDGLLSDIAKLQRSFRSGELPLSERTSAFLCEWLSRHIRTSDTLLGSVVGSLEVA